MAKKRKRAPRQHVAKLTIWRAGEMTRRGRREVAAWLRASAADLEEMGEQYAPRFSARYMAR